MMQKSLGCLGWLHSEKKKNLCNCHKKQSVKLQQRRRGAVMWSLVNYYIKTQIRTKRPEKLRFPVLLIGWKSDWRQRRSMKPVTGLNTTTQCDCTLMHWPTFNCTIIICCSCNKTKVSVLKIICDKLWRSGTRGITEPVTCKAAK